MAHINRRRFLSGSAAGFLVGAGALSALSQHKAYAANTSGYKALVCLFFAGGMDHADTVLPYDQPGYDALLNVRPGVINGHGAARARENLLPLNATNSASFGGRSYALAPELAPLGSLFDQGDMAVIGGVGPLIEPVSLTTMENDSVTLPKRLFSHNDQQSIWTSLEVEGARYGWGGRFADAMIAADPTINPIFASISTGNSNVFLAGENARQFSAPNGGPKDINLYTKKWYIGYGDDKDQAREKVRSYFAKGSLGSGNMFNRDFANANQRAITNSDGFRNAIENITPFTTEFPDTGMGRQLKAVAETISIQGALNVSRQVFYTKMGGFDTHSGQTGKLPELHTEIAEAVAAFRNAMGEIGMWDSVTLFTASDFGRTTTGNGDGTDHGWGGHHFVMGGSVAGQKIYGSLPDIADDTERFTKSRGRLIPTISVEQYAATLGQWFGLDSFELNQALPNLNRFDAQTLDFMQAGIG